MRWSWDYYNVNVNASQLGFECKKREKKPSLCLTIKVDQRLQPAIKKKKNA